MPAIVGAMHGEDPLTILNLSKRGVGIPQDTVIIIAASVPGAIILAVTALLLICYCSKRRKARRVSRSTLTSIGPTSGSFMRSPPEEASGTVTVSRGKAQPSWHKTPIILPEPSLEKNPPAPELERVLMSSESSQVVGMRSSSMPIPSDTYRGGIGFPGMISTNRQTRDGSPRQRDSPTSVYSIDTLGGHAMYLSSEERSGSQPSSITLVSPQDLNSATTSKHKRSISDSPKLLALKTMSSKQTFSSHSPSVESDTPSNSHQLYSASLKKSTSYPRLSAVSPSSVPVSHPSSGHARRPSLPSRPNHKLYPTPSPENPRPTNRAPEGRAHSSSPLQIPSRTHPDWGPWQVNTWPSAPPRTYASIAYARARSYTARTPRRQATSDDIKPSDRHSVWAETQIPKPEKGLLASRSRRSQPFRWSEVNDVPERI